MIKLHHISMFLLSLQFPKVEWEPLPVQEADTLGSFKSKPKSFLFDKVYNYKGDSRESGLPLISSPLSLFSNSPLSTYMPPMLVIMFVS